MIEQGKWETRLNTRNLYTAFFVYIHSFWKNKKVKSPKGSHNTQLWGTLLLKLKAFTVLTTEISTNPESFSADISFSEGLRSPLVPDVKDETFRDKKTFSFPKVGQMQITFSTEYPWTKSQNTLLVLMLQGKVV